MDSVKEFNEQLDQYTQEGWEPYSDMSVIPLAFNNKRAARYCILLYKENKDA